MNLTPEETILINGLRQNEIDPQFLLQYARQWAAKMGCIDSDKQEIEKAFISMTREIESTLRVSEAQVYGTDCPNGSCDV